MDCNKCRWFDSQKNTTVDWDSKTGTWKPALAGICRRYPPRRSVFQDTGDATSGWPTTSGHDWCGEWENIVDDSIAMRTAVAGRRRTDWEDDRKRILEATKRIDAQMRRPTTASS